MVPGGWTADEGPRGAPDRDSYWAHPMECESGCLLAVDDENLYVVEQQVGPDELAALDGETGTELWREPVGQFATGLWMVQGALIVGVDEQLSRWDPATGDQIWSMEVDSPLLEIDGALIIRGTDVVQAVDLADGTEWWRVDGWVTTGCRGTLYLLDNDDDHVVAIDSRSGEELWRFTDEGYVYDACSDGALIVLTDLAVMALDPSTGNPMWSHPFHSGRLLVAMDDAVVVWGDDHIVGLDAGSGEELWQETGYPLIHMFPLGDGRALGYARADGSEDAWIDLLETTTARRVGSVLVPWHRSRYTYDAVYLARGSSIDAYDTDRLEHRWSLSVDEKVIDLIVGGGNLYLVSEGVISAHR